MGEGYGLDIANPTGEGCGNEIGQSSNKRDGEECSSKSACIEGKLGCEEVDHERANVSSKYVVNSQWDQSRSNVVQAK